MKKFLIILSCVALLLPAAALSAFADSSYNVVNNVGAAVVLRVVDLSDGSSFDASIASSGGSLSLPEGLSFSLRCIYNGSSYVSVFYRVLGSSALYSPSTDSSNPTVISDNFDCFVLGPSGSTSSTFYYFSTPSPDPFEELGVNDGVDSSISYTGQVLSFLANNTTTLVLIGLSVAMFAVLPFAISKIKQLIKGY